MSCPVLCCAVLCCPALVLSLHVLPCDVLYCPVLSCPAPQALIPFYTGKIIDFASIDPDPRRFRDTTLKMLGVALGCAVFTGVRGGLFTVAMTRLNVRLRQQLYHSLMHQVGGWAG